MTPFLYVLVNLSFFKQYRVITAIIFYQVPLIMPSQPFIQMCSLVTFDELTCALENCCRGQKVKIAFQLELGTIII